MFRGVVGMFIALLILGGVATGCGGGGRDTSLTAAEFKKQADAICARAEKAKDESVNAAVQGRGKKSGKAFEEELVGTAALPPIADMTEELRDLGGPSGEEKNAEAMVAAFEEETQKLEADPASALNGAGGQFEKANEAAEELGLEACSRI